MEIESRDHGEGVENERGRGLGESGSGRVGERPEQRGERRADAVFCLAWLDVRLAAGLIPPPPRLSGLLSRGMRSMNLVLVFVVVPQPYRC